MTDRNEQTRRLNDLLGQRDSLISQRSALTFQQSSNPTSEARLLISRIDRQLAQLNVEISRLQNTPAANNESEQTRITNERFQAIREAREALVTDNTQDDEGDVADRPNPPHFFEEQAYQVFHHDFIVYIQGTNVTPYVMGSLSVSLGCNESINTISLTLNNTGDLFTITPENVAGIWRLGPDLPYSEEAKKSIYDIKNDPSRNPFDSASGGRRWNLSIYGAVFHRNDPIRVWVHNPVADDTKNEWVPIFTGYLTTKSVHTNWVNGESTVQLQAQDIRALMQHMRVQTNTVNFESPHARAASAAATPAGANPGQTVVSAISLRVFNSSTLIRGFNERTDSSVTSGSIEASRTNLNNAISEQIDHANQAIQESTGTLGVATDLAFFRDFVRNDFDHTHAWTGLGYLQISHALTVGDTSFPISLNQVGQDLPPENIPTSTAGQRSEDRRARNRLRHSVGRMREGVAYRYPDPDNNSNSSSGRFGAGRNQGQGRNETAAAQDPAQDDISRNRRILSRWYKLCFFGSPIRNSPSGSLATRLAPSTSESNFRYWQEDEVHLAGSLTLTDGIWAPDMQLAHWLIPRQGTEALSDNNLVDVAHADSSTILTERNWSTRFDFLMDMTKLVDYRVWVTGVGDIVFEFPMYDFYPDDFGAWAPVMQVDEHLMETTVDEEHGDPPTVVIATGSFTRRTDVGASLQSNPLIVPPSKLVWSPVLASRLGIKIEVTTYSWLNNPEKLQRLAIVRMQKALMEADSFAANFGYRLFLSPNRPVYFIPNERLALTNTVTHNLEIHGDVSTTADLFGSRYMDIYGVRRNLTGGRALPLSFAAIPGAGFNTVVGQRDLVARVERLLADGFSATDIVYGTVDRMANGNRRVNGQGNYTLVTESQNGSTTRSLTPGQLTTLTRLRTALNSIEGASGFRRALAIGGRDVDTRPSADELINRVIDRGTLPAGRSEFNVVPGFQSARSLEASQTLQNEAQGVVTELTRARIQLNQVLTQVRSEMQNQRFNPESGALNLGVGGLRTTDQIEEAQRQFRHPPNLGSRALNVDAFAARREPVHFNQFGCEGVSRTVDFVRQLREAGHRILPNLTPRQIDFLIAHSAFETRSGAVMRNNNVSNIIVRSNNWAGPWHHYICCQYASYPDLEQGMLALYNVIQNAFSQRVRSRFNAGNDTYFSAIYAEGFNAKDRGEAYGQSQLGTFRERINTFRRLEDRIRSAPACNPEVQAQISERLSDAVNRRQRPQRRFV